MTTGPATPRAVLVLGMHRSGTSALAGTFSLLGFSLGDDLLPAVADDNPKGYFEHAGVVRAHDRLLAAFGMDWADWRALPEGWMRHPVAREVRDELHALLEALLAGGRTAVIKDPRACRFLPLWRALFADMGVEAHYAFIARHPVEVAASLRRRGGMSENRAGLLSLAHQLEAEHATRDASRLFMTYEDLIGDWRTQIARCHAAFGIGAVPDDPALAATVDGFLDAQLRNHRATDAFALDPDTMDAYRCIQAAARSDDAGAVAETFDAIRPRFEAARRGHAAALDAALSAIEMDRARHVPAWTGGLGLANAWNAPPLAALPASAPKLYLRGLEGTYSEEGMLEGQAVLSADGTCLATFALDPGTRLERVRFDPDGRAGAYALIGMRIDGREVADLPARVKVIWETRLEPSLAGAIAWASDDDDPWIELDLLAPPCPAAEAGASRVELRFRRLTAHALTEEAAAGRHAQQAASLEALHRAVDGLGAAVLHSRELHAAGQDAVVQKLKQAQSALDGQQAARLEEIARQIGALSQVVIELKQRSDRPLLHRLGRKWRDVVSARRDPDGGWALRLAPLANLSTHEGRWRSVQRDPQFSLLRPRAADSADGIGIGGGWHLLTIQARVLEGRLVNPCLYPDYGRGMLESDRIELPAFDPDGRIETMLYLRPGLKRLRFDPSDRDASFSIDAALRPVTRLGALRHMLGRLWRDAGGDVAAAWRLARSLLAGAFRRGGVRGGILARYQRLQFQEPGDYGAWLVRHEPRLSAEQVDARLSALPRRPLLSVVMPVYQTPEHWLRRALDTVIGQHYPDWELCISDDASPSPHVRAVLEEYRQLDRRIKVVYRERNGHISESSNSALEIAGGEYMVLLDHDDELHPEALLLVAETLCRHPEAAVVYSDEDKIDEDGNRFHPYFKPDWNYDLLLGQNCISHLGVFSMRLVREVGAFRKGLEGAQDWDLALRCIERIAPERIVHIPRVLYHWRAIQGSTALAAGEKNYAVQAGARAVREHLQRSGQAAEVSILPESMLRVKRGLRSPPPKVSLVIPTRDRVDLLRVCVDSILERSTYPDYEILVVDNGSTEQATLDYFAAIASRPDVRVLSWPGEFNYSAINNFAVGQARGEVVGLVNNDIEVIAADWMEEMVSHAMRPDAGAVGAMLYYPDDTIQHAGVLVGVGGVAGHIGSRQPRGSAGYFGRLLLTQELSAVTAACLLVRRSVYEEVGGLDERLRVAFNDVDLCLRIRARGYRNLWTPFAELYHHESASRGLEDNPEKLARFMSEVAFMQERWGGALLQDRAYNPNLSLSEPFVLGG